MALQKESAHLMLTKGLDLKTDPRLQIPTSLPYLTDAVFDDKDTIIVRPGLTERALTVLQSGVFNGTTPLGNYPGPVGTVYDIQSFGDRLLIANANGIHQDVQGQIAQIRTDGRELSSADMADSTFHRTDVTTAPVGASVFGQDPPSNPDCATNGAFSCYAWEQFSSALSTLGLEVVLVDEATGERVQVLQLGTATTTCARPRVLWSSTAAKFFVYYVSVTGGVYEVKMTPIGTDYSIGTERTITAIVAASFLFDAEVGAAVYVAAYSAAATVRHMSLSLADGYTVVDNQTVASSANLVTLSAIITDYSGTIRYTALYTTTGSANTVRASAMLVGGATVAEQTIATGIAATTVGRVTAIDRGSSFPWFNLFYDNRDYSGGGAPLGTPADCDTTRIRSAYVTKTLLSTNDSTGPGSGCFIAGRPQSILGGAKRAMLVSRIGNLSSYFLIDITEFSSGTVMSGGEFTPFVLARIDYGNAGTISGGAAVQGQGGLGMYWYGWARIPACPAISFATMVCPYHRWTSRLEYRSGKIVTPITVARATVTFGNHGKLNSVEAQGSLVMAGGCPQMFDGRIVHESGFNWVPTIASAAESGAGALATIGTYGVRATYAWQDAGGYWHESGPSDAVFFTTTGVNKSYAVSVCTQRLTRKTRVQIRLYRTTVGGSTYYLDGKWYLNDVDATYATVAAGSAYSDTALITSSLLKFFTGGQLLNEPLPPCRHIAIHQNRLVFSGGDDGRSIRLTHSLEGSLAPEYNSAVGRDIPMNLGRVVGTAADNGRLTVFCENQIGLLFGTGPNVTGGSDSWSEVEPATNTIGALFSAPRAILADPGGVWFQSPVGIRYFVGTEIQRNESGGFVGSEVDEFATAATRSLFQAIIPEDKDQVYFAKLVSDFSFFQILVFDRLFGQWSRFTTSSLNNLVGAAFTQGKLFVSDGSKVAYFNPAELTDLGSTLNLNFTTPWIQLAGVMGFQRAYEFSLLGQGTGPGTATISAYVFYDYDESGYATELSGAAVGGRPVRFRHQFARQKCSAIRLNIAARDSGTRLRLSDLVLLIGKKAGYSRQTPKG